MVNLEKQALMPPNQIMQVMGSRWAIEALRVGVSLDVFSKLSKGPKSAHEVAAELSANEDGIEFLMNALTALGFLEKNGKYSNSEQAETYLSTHSQLYFGDYVLDDRVAQAWMKLADVIKTGKPANTVNQVEKAEEFFPKLAETIFPMNYGTAHLVATELKIETLPAPARVLDVAAGSGVWSLPLAERNKKLHVDAVDFPAVLKVTEKFAARHGVADRYSYISGDWSDCDFKDDYYDVVCLGHILHSEGKERSEALLKASYKCLKPGGKLVVAEMISDNERCKAVFPQLFAINMFLLTEKGCVFTLGELEEMFAAAGFKEISRPILPNWGAESPVMLATK